MVRYVIRRLLWAVVLFVAVTLLTFVMFYRDPGQPGSLVAGKAATPAAIKHVTPRALPRPAAVRPVRPLPEGAGLGSQPGLLLRQPPERELDHRKGGAGDGGARVRRRHPVAAGGDPGRHLLGPAAALEGRPRGDGGRAGRHLGAPGVGRLHAVADRRLQAEPAADPGLLQLTRGQRGPVLRRAVRLVHAHAAALDHLRHPLLGVLRADDPLQRDGDAERGLRAHGSCQGRSGAAP